MSAIKKRDISPWCIETKEHSNSFNSTAKLSNTINNLGFGAFNHKGIINYEDILNSYSRKVLEDAWIQFSNFIKKNYEMGKGTKIKGFGTFTFTCPEYNLEGTTNQYKRDFKFRRPVFIVSKEFVDFLKPGKFSKSGGLVYHSPKSENNISIVKFNYSELAYSLNISKEECQQIIMTLLKEMEVQIINNKFKSRELPGLGIILIRGNILGIKFYTDFNKQVLGQTEKLNFTKKNLKLFMNVNKSNQPSGDIINVEKAIKDLTPKSSVITHLTGSAENWLKKNMNIKPEEYDNDEETKKQFNNIENYDRNQIWKSNMFFKAPSSNKIDSSFKTLKTDYSHNYINQNLNNNDSKTIINNLEKKSLRNLSFPKEILEALIANKGQIILQMKNYDKRNNGQISRFEVVRSFSKANVHPSFSIKNINEIIQVYADNLDYIEYYKLITSMIKEAKQILKSKYIGKDGFDYLSSSFNNKFRFGKFNTRNENTKTITYTNTSIKQNDSNNSCENLNEFDIKNYNNLEVNLDDVEKEILSIKIIFSEIMQHKKTYFRSIELEKFLDNDNIINYLDFIQLLRVFDIIFPSHKIFQILKFIKIENPKKMTLNILNDKLIQCKLTSSEMSNSELDKAIKDLLLNKKLNLSKNLFKDVQGEDLSLNQFLKEIHNKTIYSDNILTELFYKLTNKKPFLKFNDFISLYNNPIYLEKNTNSQLNKSFYEQSCEKINKYIKSNVLNASQYFNKLLNYNMARKSNTLGMEDFVLAMLQEPYEPEFTRQQIEYIFLNMDTNQDNRLDRDEFKNAITKEYNALSKMQDMVKNSKLTVDDIAYRLGLENESEKILNFYQFKTKMKNMSSFYTNEFIEGLYNELAGSLDKPLNSKVLLDNLDVYKKSMFININNENFTKNFISNIQNVVDYHTLKDAFEKEDKKFTGKLSKSSFSKIINMFTKEYKDEEITRFVRLNKLTDDMTYEVKYMEFIKMIFYNEKLDSFLLCVNEIQKLYDSLKQDVHKVISIINQGDKKNYLTPDKLLEYLQSKIKIEDSNIKIDTPINKTLICKFDLDGDGKISFEDLVGIIKRYTNTSFFKYENSDKGQNVNLFSSNVVNDEEFKTIVKEIKNSMKKKNITEIGLFYKLDEDNDGLINNHEFNKNISSIVEIGPSIKDKLFNYLDFYHNGLVDLETFLLRFKEFRSNEVIICNNNRVENDILNELSEFIRKNSKKLNDVEIFSIMDKDCDGMINLDDFKYFVMDSLGKSKIEFTDCQLERVMQSISLTKNKNIGIGDIREYMNKSLANNIDSYYVDTKEIFKETTNLNLHKDKKNSEWISQAIERLGMFITEKYECSQNFFKLYADNELNKFKFDHFLKFNETNYECFHGFNLTKDELLTIFTTLDSQKKNYLTLDDFKNKLELFDFYKKMHLDIKNFLITNFPSHIDSFKYFFSKKKNDNNLATLDYSINQKQNKLIDLRRTFTKGFYKPFNNGIGTANNETIGNQTKRTKLSNLGKKFYSLNNPAKTYITKKEFFDGINNLFPMKYTTETILKYMKKYFNINIKKENENELNLSEKITFSQFTFIYYGKICDDSDILANNNNNYTQNLNNGYQPLKTTSNFGFRSKRSFKLSTTRTSAMDRIIHSFDKFKKINSSGKLGYNHNLYPNEDEVIGLHPTNHLDHPIEFLAHEKLITPFDNDPLEKARRLIVNSPNQNYLNYMKDFLDKHSNTEGICNEFEFKNMLKKLYLGLTNVEIDDIIRRCGRNYDGKLSMKDFYKFITSKDKNIAKATNNIAKSLGEIKQLLYKYYSNPKLAFTFYDGAQSNIMDFEKYKIIITDMYNKEERPLPNFALLKNTFDCIDQRKDGVIDLVEWTNTFGSLKSKLDVIGDQKSKIKTLRKWETSNDIINIYKAISKNRKILIKKVSEKVFSSDCNMIQEDNLIEILKDILPFYQLSKIQWKMIVELGEKDPKGFINFDSFIKIVEKCSKREEMPRFI